METPKTLLEAVQYFSDAENCRKFMISVRWADGVVRCPYCDSEKVTYLENARLYRCYGKHPKQKFSLKVGTVFEDSPIGLEKWLPASWLLSNCKNGVSSYELARAIGVTQKSAWFMLHRIRLAMKDEPKHPMGWTPRDPVEVDETFIGGKPKNMHRRKRLAQTEDHKVIVMGMLDRGTRQVRAKVIPNVKRETLQAEILKNVGRSSHIFTDQHVGYEGLRKMNDYVHKTVMLLDVSQTVDESEMVVRTMRTCSVVRLQFLDSCLHRCAHSVHSTLYCSGREFSGRFADGKSGPTARSVVVRDDKLPREMIQNAAQIVEDITEAERKLLGRRVRLTTDAPRMLRSFRIEIVNNYTWIRKTESADGATKGVHVLVRPYHLGLKAA